MTAVKIVFLVFFSLALYSVLGGVTTGLLRRFEFTSRTNDGDDFAILWGVIWPITAVGLAVIGSILALITGPTWVAEKFARFVGGRQHTRHLH